MEISKSFFIVHDNFNKSKSDQNNTSGRNITKIILIKKEGSFSNIDYSDDMKFIDVNTNYVIDWSIKESSELNSIRNDFNSQINRNLSNLASQSRMELISAVVSKYYKIIKSNYLDDESAIFFLQREFLNLSMYSDYSFLGESIQQFMKENISNENIVQLLCNSILLFPKNKLGSYAESIISMLLVNSNPRIIESGLILLFNWSTPEMINFYKYMTFNHEWMNVFLKGICENGN